jgi:polysaccharide export outer membrane protein
MRDGDRLLIPKATQVVTVLGETQQNSSHLYQPGISRDEYIDLSGGVTRRADKKLIYVVRASGAVVAGNGSKWLGRGQKVDIRPGDTIVVPLDTDRMRPLTFWGNVTQILYQGAIAVAAVKTFNN